MNNSLAGHPGNRAGLLLPYLGLWCPSTGLTPSWLLLSGFHGNISVAMLAGGFHGNVACGGFYNNIN